jgi:hypothetical protein
MWAVIAVKETTTEVWEAIKNMRVGSEALRDAKAQRLQREFESIEFRDGEHVDDFCLRLSNLVAALATVSEVILEKTVVKKLLQVAPKRLAQVAVAIEVTADLGKLTIEDIGGRLRTAEDRAAEDEATVRADGKLLLTAEQWEPRAKQQQGDDSGGSGFAAKKKARGKRGSGAGKKEGVSGSSSRPPPGGRSYRSNQCRRCMKTGHWAR